METRHELSRRRLLGLAALGGGVAALLAACGGAPAAPAAEAGRAAQGGGAGARRSPTPVAKTIPPTPTPVPLFTPVPQAAGTTKLLMRVHWARRALQRLPDDHQQVQRDPGAAGQDLHGAGAVRRRPGRADRHLHRRLPGRHPGGHLPPERRLPGRPGRARLLHAAAEGDPGLHQGALPALGGRDRHDRRPDHGPPDREPAAHALPEQADVQGGGAGRRDEPAEDLGRHPPHGQATHQEGRRRREDPGRLHRPHSTTASGPWSSACSSSTWPARRWSTPR